MRSRTHASGYIGVDMGNENYDDKAEVSPHSKVAFLWTCRHTGGHVRKDVVTPFVKNVSRRGVPAPNYTRKDRTSIPDLELYASKAASGAKDHLQEHLGLSDLDVTCNYIGIVGASGIDINAARLGRSTAAFEWTIQTLEYEWKEEARVLVRDCSTRLIPMPSCTVTHARLHSAARAASQTTSDLFGFEIKCVYPVFSNC